MDPRRIRKYARNEAASARAGPKRCHFPTPAPPGDVSRRLARQRAARGDRARHRRASGRHRQWRDRLGQDDPVAQDLPGARSRACANNRAYPAASPCGQFGGASRGRGAQVAAWRTGGLPGAVSGPQLQFDRDQADDRRHSARRDPARSDAAPLRHDHHRRGA